jgi:hypothetical protein
VSLDPSRVPESVRPLISLAERWGIPDDGFREEALAGASSLELSDILQRVESYDSDLNAWLCGDESFSKSPSAEYVAFSALLMAADWANVELRKRNYRLEDM